MLIPRHYETLDILHEHTLPPRAYYIPASTPMDTLVEHREDSDRFQLLSGQWRFRSILPSMSPAYGRHKAMTLTNTSITVTPSPSIPLMSPRITPAAHMYIHLLTIKTHRLRKSS